MSQKLLDDILALLNHSITIQNGSVEILDEQTVEPLAVYLVPNLA